MSRNRLITAAVLAGAVCAAGAAAAQGPSIIGTWRAQTTTAGAGGYGVLVNIEEVFQPGGNYSSLSSSYYTNGPAAGMQIGAIQASGNYKLQEAQGVLEFHMTHHTTTGPETSVPSDEYDHYQFLSPTTLALQSLSGGPVVTFTKVQ